MNITIKFGTFQSVLLSNFSLNRDFSFFRPYAQKKHNIQTTLVVLDKNLPKFQSTKEKVYISIEFRIFELDEIRNFSLSNVDFLDQICPKWVILVYYRKGVFELGIFELGKLGIFGIFELGKIRKKISA